MKYLSKILMQHGFFLLSFFVACVAIFPLLHPGLIPTHDGEYHLIRFYEFDKILRSGNWYPRWAPDLNFSYGIPLFTYVYPLPNYVASFLHLLGNSFLDSVKLNMVLATLVGSIFCYLWAKLFWGKLGGFVSSIFYTYAPYHFVDIYVRGSVGEVWALALFPGFLWSYTIFAKTRKSLFFVVSCIFLALIIFSHNILALMFFVFMLAHCSLLILGSNEKKFLILYSFFIILLGLGLSSIFWLPALLETTFVTGLQIYNIAQNFPDLSQLLFPSWGTGFFGTNPANEMSVQIGTMNLLAIVTSVVYFFGKLLKKNKTNAPLIGFYLLWFFVLIICMLPFSLPVWNIIPLFHYFQFPWRLLSLVILVCAFLAGSLITVRYGKIIAIGFVLLLFIATYSYTQPAYYMLRSDQYYTSRSNFIDSTNSPGNTFHTVWDSNLYTKRPTTIADSSPNIHVVSIKKDSPTAFAVSTNSQYTSIQQINISYFPGWIVSVDRKNVSTFPKKGLLSFSLPKGQHIVFIHFEQTLLEQEATVVTLLSLGILLILLLRSCSKKSNINLWEN